MPASSLELLGFTARRLIQFEKRFYEGQSERRRELSRYFQQLSAAIEALHQELGRQKIPHDAVRELARLTSLLPAQVENEIGTSETGRLHHFLVQACDTERVYREYQGTENIGYLSDELQKAVILLRALGQGLFSHGPDIAQGHPLPPLPGY